MTESCYEILMATEQLETQTLEWDRLVLGVSGPVCSVG